MKTTTEHAEDTERARERIARLLPAGESVRWIGRPVPRCFHRWVPLHMFLGVFLLTTAALLFRPFYTATEDLSGWVRVCLLSILFVPWAAEGILLVLSPLRRYLADRATIYAVTDRHAIRRGRWRGKVWTIRAEPVRKNRRAGLASVQFATWTSYFGGTGYSGLPIHHPIAFENLTQEEANKAEETLWQAYRLVTNCVKMPNFETEVTARLEENENQNKSTTPWTSPHSFSFS